MNQAPEGMQAGVVMLDADGLLFGIPVFLPAGQYNDLYNIGETIANKCWPNANYHYTEYADETR